MAGPPGAAGPEVFFLIGVFTAVIYTVVFRAQADGFLTEATERLDSYREFRKQRIAPRSGLF
jgi:hypothetical protein